MIGCLYLIPTPIGNLGEVSPRTIETLTMVDFVACEDTRNTSKLLSLLGISKPCFSCHEHNEREASEKIITKILEGQNVAYASDAGYPCISDPGSLLVKLAIEKDIQVIPISGPNAFLNALVGSGLDTSHFLFYGFLNSKDSIREKELSSLKSYPETLIFYEAPHRINETLVSLEKVLGNRGVCVARELTKMHEEFIRSTLSDLVSQKLEYKGELVVVVEGAKENSDSSIDEATAFIEKLVDEGLSKKDATIAASMFYGINKNQLKKLLIKK